MTKTLLEATLDNLRHATDTHLPETILAFMSGSFPYGGAVPGRSDIDLNVILPDSSTPPSEAFLARVSRLVVELDEIHTALGMRIDRRCPGEYFTHSQLSDAIHGRGLDWSTTPPTVPAGAGDHHYWESSVDTWYLAWLGASAFSTFVTGGRQAFRSAKAAAWRTIVAICLPDLRQITAADTIERIMDPSHPSGPLGVDQRYAEFGVRESPWIEQAIRQFEQLGVVGTSTDGAARLDREALCQWWCERKPAAYAAPLFTIESSRQIALGE